MREILFRGKRTDNGEWVVGAYFCLHHNDGRDHLHHFIIPNDTPIPKDRPIGEVQVEVDPSTVGQYTGLPDKNGKWIFEGDIVEGPDFDAEDGYAVVHWDDDTARFTIDGQGLTVDFDNYYGYDIEIIGNVPDNPELLERGRE